MSQIFGRSTSTAYRPASKQTPEPAQSLCDPIKRRGIVAVNLPESDLRPPKTRPVQRAGQVPLGERSQGKASMRQ
jgi:hypothetical protein